ncbi:MAG: hypothetical protein JNK05_08665 [Myxococcales bacterium]|nr:hypothetical protein [Myxococcales bacterium]
MRPREEAVYAGALAATRRDVAFVTSPDGSSRKVELVVSVNAATDPVLAEAARNGTLHHVDSLDLAVPFAYHDPVARKFAWVVPLVRAHEEIALRIELLRKLADERAPLPAYVRDARVAVGPKGLDRFLNEPDLQKLAARETQIAAREERLHTRAEDVTRREDDLRTQLDQLTADKAQLELRAEELAVREVAIAARENELAAARARFDADRDAHNKQLAEQRRSVNAPRDPTLRQSAASRSVTTSAAETSQPIELLAKRASNPKIAGAESIEEAEPIEPEAPADDAAIEEAAPLDDEPAANLEPIESESIEPAPEEAEPIEPAPAEIADDSQDPGESIEPVNADEPEPVDELDPLEGETSPADDELLAATPTAAAGEARREVSWLTGERDSRAAVVDGEVRLWLRGTGDTVMALSTSEAVPVLQADPSSSLPLALLSVLSNDSATRFGRAALDATTAEDRAVIDALARDFHVRVEVVSRDGRSLGGHAVSARGGEAHARSLGEVLAKRASGDALARRVEADRLAREGVSLEGLADAVTDDEERALFDEQQLATAQGVERAIAAIAKVASPEARAKWQLARGVPNARLEASEKRVLFAMLRVGIRPPPAVLARALALSVASDEKALAQKSLAAFSRTCDSGPTTVGLDPRRAYELLGALISWAHLAGVSPLPPSALDAMGRLYDPETMDGPEVDDPRPIPSEAEMSVMDAAELTRWCAHPKARAAAALRLAKKDARTHAATLVRALKVLEPREAAPVLAAMLPAGDELGDAWVELANSKRPVAAAAGAVAIAKIKLRRGLVTVLQRALSAGTTESQLFGWAAGEFGTGAVRAIAPSMLDGDGVERCAWVLAHVVRAGGGREVERIRTSEGGALAAAATQGVGAVDDARDYDKALREAKGLTPGERAASAFLAVI